MRSACHGTVNSHTLQVPSMDLPPPMICRLLEIITEKTTFNKILIIFFLYYLDFVKNHLNIRLISIIFILNATNLYKKKFDLKQCFFCFTLITKHIILKIKIKSKMNCSVAGFFFVTAKKNILSGSHL